MWWPSSHSWLPTVFIPHLFIDMARRGNFDVLGKYAWCVPSGADIFILLLLLLLGALLGNVVVFLFNLALGPAAAAEYGMLVSYPVMFIPPMIWAAGKSGRNRMRFKGLALDNANVDPLGWALCIVMVMAATLAAGIVGDLSTSVLPDMPSWLKSALENLTAGNLWVNFLCVSIFAPFFEEWLCRGMVERGLLGRGVKPAWAIHSPSRVARTLGEQYVEGLALGLGETGQVRAMAAQLSACLTDVGKGASPSDVWSKETELTAGAQTGTQDAQTRERTDAQRDERLCELLSAALSGVEVRMDGRAVGTLVAPTVSQMLADGARSRRFTA